MSSAEHSDSARGRSNAFLEGEGVEIELAGIEDELERLWGPAAEQAGGPEVDQPSVTRLVLANVVVAALDDTPEETAATVRAITSNYPCRVIVLRPGNRERQITAEVSAVCHLPAPGRPQVCSERIVLRIGPKAIDMVPAAVRPLLISDLHTILWWRDHPEDHPELREALSEDSTRLLLDRPDPDSKRLRASMAMASETTDPPGHDLTWFAITPWRETIAQLFDPPGIPLLHEIESVRIVSESANPDSIPRIGVWLLSWLAGQLGWKPTTEVIRSPGALQARFQGPGGSVQGRLFVHASAASKAARLLEVEIRLRKQGPETECLPPGLFLLRRSTPEGTALRVEIHAMAHCELPRILVVQPDDLGRRVAAALQSDRYDPPYRRACSIARWLLSEPQ